MPADYGIVSSANMNSPKATRYFVFNTFYMWRIRICILAMTGNHVAAYIPVSFHMSCIITNNIINPFGMRSEPQRTMKMIGCKGFFCNLPIIWFFLLCWIKRFCVGVLEISY